MIKKLIALGIIFILFPFQAQAVTATPSAFLTPGEENEEATETAELLPTPTIEVKENITEPKSEESKGKFTTIIAEQEIEPLGPTNFLKHSIRFAVSQGVPANTVVLILLLPLIGALVGIIQYIVGVSGFGIFMPAMVAVTFLATGITGGLILFATILASTLITRKLIREIHLFFLPRRAITLMTISIITFFFLLISPFLGLTDLTQVSIFPILFLILLSEEFLRTQLGKSKKSAVRLTVGTLLISAIGAWLMNFEPLQKFILLNPEISFTIVLISNILIGKYDGWRLLEFERFRSLLKK